MVGRTVGEPVRGIIDDGSRSARPTETPSHWNLQGGRFACHKLDQLPTVQVWINPYSVPLMRRCRNRSVDELSSPILNDLRGDIENHFLEHEAQVAS